MARFVDLTGQRFGRLAVLRRVENRGKKACFACRCDCGNEREVCSGDLNNKNKSQSCGCLRNDAARSKRIDLLGRKFGMLTVEHCTGHRKGNYHYKCTCKCGKETEVVSYALSGGTIKSCGCLLTAMRGEGSVAWKGFGEISGSHWRTVTDAARSRGIDLALTIEEAWSLFVGQNGLCALSGLPIGFSRTVSTRTSDTTASLDRIDSGDCYRVGNCQWVHKHVNRAKMGMGQEDFIQLCRQIADHNKPE